MRTSRLQYAVSFLPAAPRTASWSLRMQACKWDEANGVSVAMRESRFPAIYVVPRHAGVFIQRSRLLVWLPTQAEAIFDVAAADRVGCLLT
jgi:hypothetical protein